MAQMWDADGEASAALERLVAGFGQQVLDRPDMLEGLLQDEVPEHPREVALLTAAARSRVATLLAERVSQGISAQSAIAMAAAEMTARTAVDATGAPWAAGAFARVLGHQVTTPVTTPADDTNERATTLAPPTSGKVPRDAPTRTPDSDPAPAPPTRTASDPADTTATSVSASTGSTAPEPAWMPPPAPTDEQRAKSLAARTAVACVISAPVAPLVYYLVRSNFWDDWMWAILLAGGLISFGIWAVRTSSAGTGLAAVVGLIAPTVSIAIFVTSFAFGPNELFGGRRHVLEVVVVIGLLASFAGLIMALSGLASAGQLAGRPNALAVGVAAAGICYVLAFFFPQDYFDSSPTGNVLGTDVQGWHILWGLAFLVLYSLPLALAGLRLTSHRARIAMLAGWLLSGLILQISDSPVYGFNAAGALYVSWLFWLVVLAGTIALVRRGPARPARPATPAAVQPG